MNTTTAPDTLRLGRPGIAGSLARRSAWDFARYDCPQGVTDPLR